MSQGSLCSSLDLQHVARAPSPGSTCIALPRLQQRMQKAATLKAVQKEADMSRQAQEKEVAQVRVQGIPGRVDTSESGRHRMPFGGAEECFTYFYDTSD